jgi:hypothetical protein
MKRRILSSRGQSRGFALIITLIMLVLVAVIVVSLLTSASLDRATANSFDKHARAEMAAQSGLAAALNALVGVTGPNDFRFIAAVGDNGTPVLIPLATPDPTTGSVSLNSAAARPLYSGSPIPSASPATLTLSTVSSPKVTRQAGYIPITTTNAAGNPQEVERYAFYIDEGGSRQNLAVQGPEQSPTPRPRTYIHDPHELPVLTATVPPLPLNSAQLNAINVERALLFTPQTANPVLSTSPSNSASPIIDDYYYATASAIANICPDGHPRLSLLSLKNYVDTLSTDQTAGNPRTALVNQLLTSTQTGPWATAPSGNLFFLTKLTHYSSTQRQQIVANLLNYLSADTAPITDDYTKPTYFGVEGLANSSTNAKGHPYINFVGTGLTITLDKSGNIISTQVLGSLGLVNPWQTVTDSWSKNYAVEFTVEVHGQASGTPSNAAAYFANTQFENLTAVQSPSGPADSIAPNQGFIFPGDPTVLTYTATNSTPPNQSNVNFSNITFLIKTCRLKYIPSDGSPSFYVQTLDNLSTTAIPSPTPFAFSTSGQSSPIRYDFTKIASGLHLNNDPRLNFVASNWVVAQSTNASPNPPTPSGVIINVYGNADPNNSDFGGGLPTPSPSDQTWYTSSGASANFYVKSPAKGNATAPTFDSAGELGFIHTGLPWETLRFYVSDADAGTIGSASPAPKLRDRELLAYVQSGTFIGDYGTVPLHPQASPAPSPSPSPVPLVGGPLNINTNKRPTLLSLFLGASAILDSDATARAQTGTDPDMAGSSGFVETYAQSINATSPSILPGDFLASAPARKITDAQTTDFNREILARRTANALGLQSTRFTVYALGEARDTVSGNTITTSTVNLRAEVELQSDSNGKPEPRVLRTVYYTTN